MDAKVIKVIVCPKCGEYKHLELDMHSDGWKPDLVECQECGTTWSIASIHGEDKC